jgi:predicted flavoprotein YhiN
MPQSQPSEQELLKTVLQPLLEDFQYWFSRSRSLLETENITFLSKEQQSDLLERVKQAQQEVSTAQMLFQATNGQVGVETATLVPWHRLVSECWQVGMRWRSRVSIALDKEISDD